ncbi:hypothetical protein SEPCBS119000_000021 [Sporothrix epigloea]|uniref:Uncharacterized protein n=1 Tax=Sporothrix epigloea TaxID=1892477 RepID=A0ABP0D3W9_9PEZI
MSQANSEPDDTASHTMSASARNSSEGDEAWHTTPASPAEEQAKGLEKAETEPARNGNMKGLQDESTESDLMENKPATNSVPVTASSATGEVSQAMAAAAARQAQNVHERGDGGTIGDEKIFSDSTPTERSQSATPFVAASDASETARIFATPPLPSTPTMPSIPERPRAARISPTSSAADGVDSPITAERKTTSARPVSTASSSFATRHSLTSPLPARNSFGASIFPTPTKQRAQHDRHTSLTSETRRFGTASPFTPTASPRSSSHFSPLYLNRALPETPISMVSGSSRPPSYGGFGSSTSYGGGSGTNTSRTRPLSLPMDVPRPLRLQPSLRMRSSSNAAMGTAAGSGEAEYDMAWLRAHQSAARMARRRQREQHMVLGEYKRYLQLLDSHEGAFEVLDCFLQRLARAENETLEPENFPTSFAQQRRQTEGMESMRQETVEALTPLLAYGPTIPTSPPRAPATTTTSLASAAPQRSASSASTTSKFGSASGHSTALPPTPPLSPHRRRVQRESGMSSITETSLGGSGSDASKQDDSSSIYSDGNSTAPAASWRSSMKRASALFTGWGSGSVVNSAPASTTRFSGD